MSRPAWTPFGERAVARPTRRAARRLRLGMSRAGSGAAEASAAARTRTKDLVVACVVAGTLALLAPTGESHAQSRIGRLFSTPEQRAELDRLREDSGDGEVTAPESDPLAQEFRSEIERKAPAIAATFNGIVVRGDGHRVAWIDGVETPVGGSTPAGVHVEPERAPDGRLRIRLSLGRAVAVLAPGQSVDADGTVRNAYERRPASFAARATGEGASAARTPGGAWPQLGNRVR